MKAWKRVQLEQNFLQAAYLYDVATSSVWCRLQRRHHAQIVARRM